MTGRVCPVHGEYAADGVCRWCESAPDVECDAAVDDMRVAGYFEPSGINAKWGESPGEEPAKYSRAACDDVSIFRDQEYTFTLAEKTADAYVFRLKWVAPMYRPPTTEEYAAWLPAQHAALRWDRVARRWATKAPFDGHVRTVDGSLAFDDRCAECRRLRRYEEASHPLLPVPQPEEPP